MNIQQQIERNAEYVATLPLREVYAALDGANLILHDVAKDAQPVVEDFIGRLQARITEAEGRKAARAFDTKISSYVNARAAGESWANSLRVGDVFHGAAPAAILQGYERGTLPYTAFVDGAYFALANVGVFTNDEGGIVRIDR